MARRPAVLTVERRPGVLIVARRLVVRLPVVETVMAQSS
jgi:hypothetical protein